MCYCVIRNSKGSTSVTNGRQADKLPENTPANGAISGTPARSAEPDGRASTPDSHIDVSQARVPLRRSTSQRELDERGRDQSRSPRSGDRRGRINRYGTTIDHYSPPPPNRRRASPLDTRHTFIPDRMEHRSPDRDYRRDFSHGSPESESQLDRGNKSSPVPSRSSPPRRPSPPPRGPSSIGQPHTIPPEHFRPSSSSSPPDRIRHDGVSQDSPVFRNLSWKASGLLPRQKPDLAAPKPSDPNITDAGRERVDFNGLTAVPTGPKQSAPNLPPAVPPPHDVGAVVKRSPHIFISTKWLPAQVATVKHLHRLLAQFVESASDVHVDRSGYYITFEDTVRGRELIDMCYEKNHKRMMFRQYPLNMGRCPNGLLLPGDSAGTTLERDPDLAQVNSANAGPLSEAPTAAQGFHKQLDHSASESLATDGLPNTDPHPSLTDSHSGLPTGTPMLPMRHSSPLRIPSRQDDSSSSVSGPTSSDTSSAKRLKCHVCKTITPFDADSLLQCSSCPRRYHRRCHTQPPIPSDRDLVHSWQCRRCIKRQVQPRSRLSNPSVAATSTSSHSIGQAEEPPRKKPRLDVSEPVPALKLVDSAKATRIPEGSTRDEEGPNRTVGALSNHQPDHTQATEKSFSHSDDARFHEADNLVESSFAPSEAPKQTSIVPNGLVKFKLIHKKAIRLEMDPTSRTLEYPGDMATMDATKEPVQPGQGPESSMPKPKWAGDRNDKPVIQAGVGKVPLADQSSTNNNSASHVGSDQTTKSFEPAAGAPEIQKSPEEARAAHAPRNLNTLSNTASGIPAGTKSFEPSTDKGVPQKCTPRQPGATALRMKPSTAAVDKCSKCKKIIAYNPSGTNKFCSRCKKEMFAESGPGSVRSTSEHKTQLPNTPLENDKGDRDNADGAPEAAQVNTPADTTQALDHTLQRAQALGIDGQKTTPRIRCDSCRRRHKRCDHQNPTPGNDPALLHSHKSLQQGDEIMGDGRSEGDLDFWTVKATPENTNTLPNDKTPSKKLTVDTSLAMEPLPEDGEITSPLSSMSLESEENPSPSSKPQSAQQLRKSYTTVATSEYDLGNSFERPKGTYQKLIGMALCDAPNRCLKASEVRTLMTAPLLRVSSTGDGLELPTVYKLTTRCLSLICLLTLLFPFVRL